MNEIAQQWGEAIMGKLGKQGRVPNTVKSLGYVESHDAGLATSVEGTQPPVREEGQDVASGPLPAKSILSIRQQGEALNVLENMTIQYTLEQLRN
jgi:hypothetical protein